MCGIVGYIGTKKASPILINGLLRLEYRGYDSAGIATMEDDKISVMKDKGRVKNLYNLPGIDDLKGTIGIAHTRWATHGKPSKENSHPHIDNSESFAVVHNGIIENYNELRKFLTDNGYKFYSETDTEIVPNLIHYYYSKDTSNDSNDDMKILRAVKNACKDLKGSFALEIISKYDKDHMIVLRKDSPLVIGKGVGENYISSDIPAILSFTREFYLLNDLEFAVLSREDIRFYDTDLQPIDKKVQTIEQPTAIRETIGAKLDVGTKCSFDELDFTKEYLKGLHKIYLVACGTAMHAGLAGKNMLEKLCRVPTEVDIASEFRYRDPIIDDKTLCIFISQSGETADTIAALKLSREKGAKTLAISNVIGSSITREADYSIYTHAGPEIAVASTKAYTSQVVLLAMLAIYFAETMEESEVEVLNLKKEILELPKKLEETLKCEDRIKGFGHRIYQEKDVFFLGRGIDETVVTKKKTYFS